MVTVTTMTVLKLGIKLAITFGGVVAIANLVNWLNKKSFKKKGGGRHDLDSSSDESVSFYK